MNTLKKEDEVVVVVNVEDLFDGGHLYFQGFIDDEVTVNKLMKNIDLNYHMMRRGSNKELTTPLYKNAELNFNYKQPIPYVIIKRGEAFFVYERLSKGGESRLHNKLSFGWGGHQNIINDNLSTPFEEVLLENTLRELNEELFLTSSNLEVKNLGLINDDSNDVGKVHIGILAILELDINDDVSVKEVDQLRGYWMSISELKDKYDLLEDWSKIAVTSLLSDNNSLNTLDLKTNIKE